MTLSVLPVTRPQLRPYQEQAIAAIEQVRRDGRDTALLVLATGCGKTVIFSELIRQWNVPTLILAHREELLTQAAEKIRALWPSADIGILGAGRDERGHHITIASVQSAVRGQRLDQLVGQGIRLVVVDEAHHSVAKSYRTILAALHAGEPDGPFLLGVTATPMRHDRHDIMTILGQPVFSMGLPEAIAKGWLCDLRGIQIRTTISLDGVGMRAGDFADEQLAAAVNRPDRNAIIVDAYRKHAAGRPALCFAVNVAHAHALSDAFNAAGVTSAALDGTTPRDERQQILSDFASGRLQVVCNCAVLTEGFDAPNVATVILARPTRSRSLYVQMAGRGTRPAPGKTDCLILDIADNTVRHDLAVQSLPQLVGRADYAVPVNSGDTLAGDAPATMSVRNTLDAALPPTASGRIVEREADLFSQPLAWRTQGNGDYVLIVQGIIFRLELRDLGYLPRVRFADGEVQDLAVTPMTLDWAQAVAEQGARQIQAGQGHLVDRRAAWRDTPATEKQIRTLKRLGVRVRRQVTKGEASDLISRALAKESA